MVDREAEELAHHPSVREYVKVAVILAIVTAIEVLVYYVDAIRGILVPLLAVLAVTKFALVVMWFMHLRFDSALFRRLFVAGLLLAVTVFGVMIAMFAL